MKAKTLRHAFKVRLFAVVLLATCAFAAAANAQTVAVKFTLPFEVHWGKNLLPAGQYSVTLDSSRMWVWSDRQTGRSHSLHPSQSRLLATKAPPHYLSWSRNERRVRSLNLPMSGISLIYRPATNAEREMLAKADQVQTVPVISAGK